jgi:hypothetical protein
VATRAESRADQKAWFLRALVVLQSPSTVFAAIRDDSNEVADARQDAAGAIVWFAGMAGVLATPVASTILDDAEMDWALLAVWTFLAGGLFGFVFYFVLSKVLQVALRKLGSRGSFRRARHLLAFAAVPIALAFFVYWPVRIAIFGEDLFQFDGSDGNTVGTIIAWAFYGFAVWALALLLVGIRTVHGWSWARSLAGVGLTAVFAVALAVAVSVLDAGF